MDRIAKYEIAALAVLIGILLFGVVHSARIARAERKDGLRRDEIRQVKTQLEQYFNRHERYPLQFDAGPYEYTVLQHDGIKAISWYLRGQLERRIAPASGFDMEHNIYYRVTPEGYYEICGGENHCEAQ